MQRPWGRQRMLVCPRNSGWGEVGGISEMRGVEADAVGISAVVRTWLLSSLQALERSSDRITKFYSVVIVCNGASGCCTWSRLQGSQRGSCRRNQTRDHGGSHQDGCGGGAGLSSHQVRDDILKILLVG